MTMMLTVEVVWMPVHEKAFFSMVEKGEVICHYLFFLFFRFEKEGVICGKQLGKLLRNIGQNPSEAEVRVLVMFVS